MSDYKQLRVWQQSMDFVVRIYEITQEFPKDELYGLVSQMRRAAVSVASNLAEGKGRTTSKELGYFLGNARGSLRELETQILISGRQQYIPREAEQELLHTTDDLGRMLHGLINFAKDS